MNGRHEEERSPMPLENEGNPEGLQLLRESLRKVQLESPDKVAREAGHTFVVMGASGDLARKKIYPTLWALFRDNLIPTGTVIYGYARSKLTIEEVRSKCSKTVVAKSGEEQLLEQFWASNHYCAGSYDKQRDFELLGQEMASHEKGPSNRLFYLALPPSVFKPVTTMLKVRKNGRT